VDEECALPGMMVKAVDDPRRDSCVRTIPATILKTEGQKIKAVSAIISRWQADAFALEWSDFHGRKGIVPR
jgi:hypothetical protein